MTYKITKTVCGNIVLIITDDKGRNHLERFSDEEEVEQYIIDNKLIPE